MPRGVPWSRVFLIRREDLRRHNHWPRSACLTCIVTGEPQNDILKLGFEIHSEIESLASSSRLLTIEFAKSPYQQVIR